MFIDTGGGAYKRRWGGQDRVEQSTVVEYWASTTVALHVDRIDHQTEQDSL